MQPLRIVVALAAVVVVAGCGGKSPAGKRAGAPTCKEASVVLAAKGDAKVRDPRREAAINKVCVADKWPPDLIKCVTSWPEVEDCLMRLTERQRQRYITARVAAKEPANTAEVEVGVEGGEVGDVFGGIADPPVDCASGIGDVASYDPPIAGTGDARDFMVGLRQVSVRELCDNGWPDDVRRCFADGYDATTCRSKLDAVEGQALDDRLADDAALLVRITNAGKKAANIDCKKVVAVHYGDARWQGKLGQLKPAARKKAIAASRAAMKTACTDDGWSASLRGCIVAEDSDRCLRASGQEPSRWGFPAASVGGGISTAGLFDRIGADSGVAIIAATWVQVASLDDRIRDYFANADESVLLASMTDQMCELVGGPCHYRGKDMRTAHAGMALTQADFDAFLDDLGVALDSAGVAAADRATIISLYRAMSADIVAP